MVTAAEWDTAADEILGPASGPARAAPDWGAMANAILGPEQPAEQPKQPVPAKPEPKPAQPLPPIEVEYEDGIVEFPGDFTDARIERYIKRDMAQKGKLNLEDASGRAQPWDSEDHTQLRRETPMSHAGLAEYADLFSGEDAEGNPVVVKPEEVAPQVLEAEVAVRKEYAEQAAQEPNVDPVWLREFNEDTTAMERDLDRPFANETTFEFADRQIAAMPDEAVVRDATALLERVDKDGSLLIPDTLRPVFDIATLRPLREALLGDDGKVEITPGTARQLLGEHRKGIRTPEMKAADEKILNARPGYRARKVQPRDAFWAENLLREYQQKYGNEVPRDKQTLFARANKVYEKWLKRRPSGADEAFDAWRRSEPLRDWGATEEQERVKGDPLKQRVYENISEAMVARQAFHDEGLDWVPYTLERLPFAGTAVTAADLYLVRDAVKNIEAGKATDQDWSTMAAAIDAAEKSKDRSFGMKVWDLVSHLPAMGVEFAMTGGAFTAGRAGAAKLGAAAVTRLQASSAIKAAGKIGMGRLAGGAGRLAGGAAMKAAPVAVGIGAQTAANVPLVASKVAEKWMPEYGLSRDEAGQLTVAITGDDPSFYEALGKGLGAAYIEMGSERAGAAIGKLGGLLAKSKAGQALAKMPRAQRVMGLKAAMVNRFLAKGGKVAQANGILRKAGWNGMIGEVFEERVGDVAGGTTGIEDEFGTVGKLLSNDPEGWTQLGVEAIAFAVIPGGMSLLAGADAAIASQGRRDADRVFALPAKIKADGGEVSRKDALALKRRGVMDVVGLEASERTKAVVEAGLLERIETVKELRDAEAVRGPEEEVAAEEEIEAPPVVPVVGKEIEAPIQAGRGGPQAGSGSYWSTSESQAGRYARGEGPLGLGKEQDRPGVPEVLARDVVRGAKLFAIDDTPNPQLLAALMQDETFAARWNEDWAEAEPTNKNLWDAAQDARVDIQDELRQQGFQGASHRNYATEDQPEGSRDVSIWDEGALTKPAGGDFTVYRGQRRAAKPAETQQEVAPQQETPQQETPQLTVGAKVTWDDELGPMAGTVLAADGQGRGIVVEAEDGVRAIVPEDRLSLKGQAKPTDDTKAEPPQQRSEYEENRDRAVAKVEKQHGYKVVPREPKTADERDIMDFLESRGKQGTFVDADDRSFLGGADYDTGFILLRGDRATDDLWQAVGHEVGHESGLEDTLPASAEALADARQARLDRATPRYRAMLEANPEQLDREARADLVGHFLRDKAFRDALAKKDPTLWEKIREAVLRVVGKWAPKDQARSKVLEELRQTGEVTAEAPTEETPPATKELWRATQAEATAAGWGDNWSSVVQRGIDQGADVPAEIRNELAEYLAQRDQRRATREEGPVKAQVGDTIVRYTHKDGTGLLNNSGLDRSKLTDEEENELLELMDFGMQQPAAGVQGTFYFTQEGEKKHARLLELLSKASRSGVVRTESQLTGKITWESEDGQVAAMPAEAEAAATPPAQAPPSYPPKKPRPPVPPGQMPPGTSVQNAYTEAQRKARGLPPRAPVVPRPWSTPAAEAAAKSDAEVTAVIDDIRATGRAPKNDVEVEIINRRMREAEQAHDAALASGGAAEQHRAELAVADIYGIAEKTGTKQAQAFNIRKAFHKDDYTFGGILRKAVDAKKTKSPLTPEDRAKLEKHAEVMEKLDATIAENEALREEVDKKEAEEAIDKKIAEATAKRLGTIESRFEQQYESAHEYGVDPKQVREVAQELAAAEAKGAKEYNQAFKAVQKATGLTPATIRDIEEGRLFEGEYYPELGIERKVPKLVEYRGLDEKASALVRTYGAALGLESTEEHVEQTTDDAQAIVEVLQAGPRFVPEWHDKIDDAAAMLAKDKGVESPPVEASDDWQFPWEGEDDFGAAEPAAAEEEAPPTPPKKKPARKPKPKKPSAKARKAAAKEKIKVAWQGVREAALNVGTAPTAMGIPVELVNKFIDLGRAYIEFGVTSLSEWMARAVEDGGGKEVRDNPAVFREAWRQLEAAGEVVAPDVDPNDSAAVGAYAERQFDAVLKAGVVDINDRDAVVDQVHAELKAVDPNITRHETSLAMSRYGQYRELSKDDLKVRKRQIRGELREEHKLADIRAGRPPLKSGWERPEAGAEERRLKKKVHEAMKRRGLSVTDPAKAMKSALATQKTAMRNRIEDMKKEIQDRAKIVRERAQQQPDSELNALRKEYAALKRIWDKVFPKKRLSRKMTDAAKLRLLEGALDREIATLESDLAAGRLSPARREPSDLTSPAVEAKKARLKELKEQRQAMREADPQYQAELDAKQRARYARSLERQLEDLDRREAIVASGKIPPPKPVRKTKVDQRIKDLQYERAKRKQKIDVEIERIRLADREAWQKALAVAPEITRTIKALRSSYDLSYVFRQGGWLAAGHPKLAYRAQKRSLKAFISEREFYDILEEVASRPNAKAGLYAKLDLTNIDGPLVMREEAFQGEWAEKIPLIGRGVKASERAFVAQAVQQRADVFDAMAATLSQTGAPTEGEAALIANYVNVASWRGDVGRFAQAATAAGAVLWAPRGYLSRFQLLTGQPFWKSPGKGSWRVRRLILMEYARSLAGLGIFFGTAAAFLAATIGPPSDDEDGWSISFNPYSPDFGKIRIGKTRIDPLGGLSQATRLVTRLSTNTVNGLRSAFGAEIGYESKKEMRSTPAIMGRFMQFKLTPALGMWIDLAVGEDYDRQPVTAGGAALNAVTPLSFHDISEAMQEYGVSKGAAVSLLAIFGMGLQTYQPKEVPADVEKFYDKSSALQREKNKEEETKGSVSEKTAAPAYRAAKIRSLIADLRKLNKDVDHDDPKRKEVNEVMSAVAQFGLGEGRSPLARYRKGRFKEPIDKWLGTMTYLVARTTVPKDDIGQTKWSTKLLKESGLPEKDLAGILYGKLKKLGRKTQSRGEWGHRLKRKLDL